MLIRIILNTTKKKCKSFTNKHLFFKSTILIYFKELGSIVIDGIKPVLRVKSEKCYSSNCKLKSNNVFSIFQNFKQNGKITLKFKVNFRIVPEKKMN
jgi:hypothetical protein